ncbi:MAG: hypothetical protein Q8933_01905 [Bacteroidota bacterium]|nr:hypothetical protein [Bacteroidota bacterium]MDP4194759.1 hypothetical protein [Bacteroidota bacterium]
MEENPADIPQENKAENQNASAGNKKKPKPKKSVFRKIVNVFLYTFIGIIILLALFFAFTQTSTFREILRKEVISQVNSSINGKLDIGKIDGTIFTSLIIHNASLTSGNDTLLSAGRIFLKTSPLQIFLKRIYIRNFELSDTRVNLLKDSLGVYNFSKLSKTKKESDTTKSSFPFQIIVADFKLNNISFRHGLYNNRNNDSSYEALNMNNLRVDSLYLALDAYANIDNNDFQLRISGAKAKVNLQNFRLRDLRGNFFVTDNNAKVDYFTIRSNTTDLDLFAHIDKIRLFDKGFDLAKLKNSPIRVDLNVRMFDFADLAHFAVSTNMLKGTVKTKFLASGTLGNIKIERLGLDYLQTHLNAVGFVKNLHKPKDLAFKVQIVNSYINEPDIAKLLPRYTIPVYPNLQVKNINIDYEGTPLTFKTTLKADLPEGSIAAKGDMDLIPKDIKYNFEIQTSKLNVEPVAPGVHSFLNANASIKGQGFSPYALTANTVIRLNSSNIKEYQIDSLLLTGVANKGKIVAKVNSSVMGLLAAIDANLDLRNKKDPDYSLSGQIANLNLKRFVKDTSMNTNLNFAFNLKGKSFDFNKMESQLDFVLNESRYNNKKIDPTNLRLTYTKPNANERLITLNSDFADMNIRGNYSIDNAAAIIGYESKIISQSILQKIYEFNPLAIFNDSLKAKEFEVQLKLDKTRIPNIINENMNVVFDLKIKDFKLISAFTGINKIDMDGTFGGKITNDKNGFSVSSDINMKYLKLYTNNNLVYVSNLGFNFDVTRSNNEVDFSNVSANLRLATDRVFSGSDLKNILVQMNLKKNILDFNLASDMDTTLRAQLAGHADMTRNQFEFAINKFFVDYNDIQWVNDSSLVGLYSKDEFEIKKFSLIRNNSRINLLGKILGSGMLKDLKLQVQNLDIAQIKDLIKSKTDINGLINLTATADGWMDKPLIKVEFNANNLTAGKTLLGNLQCDLDYANKLLKANLEFLDPAMNKLKPLLSATGSIPVDLGFIGVQDRMIVGQPVSFSLKSDNFELSTVSDLVPQISDLKGKMTADLNLSGTFDKLNYSGKLGLNNASFVSRQNGLPYSLDLAVSLADQTVTVDNVALHNAGGTDYKGTLSGSGKINFAGTELKTINMTLGGDLALLSSTVKTGNIPLSGRMIIQSDGDWNFSYEDGQSSFDGTVLLKNTNITFTPPQSSYASKKQDIIYNYIVDSSKVDKKLDEFNQMLALSKNSSIVSRAKSSKETSFDYNVRLRIDKNDPTTVVVVISPEVSSQLTAILDGEIIVNNTGLAQGEFNLEEGSNLAFIKSFDAQGKIFFESDLTDPRLDIVATYTGKHISTTGRSNGGTEGGGSSSSSSSEEKKVEVRLPLKGSVKELGQNLASSTQNFVVYVGDENIKNDIPSPEYGAADALSFIISGRFANELTAQDQKDQAGTVAQYAQYATPIISGLISSLANSYIGDAVQDVEIDQQRNGQTRVGISGKIESVKYSIGGTTETLQDVSKANIKFEFPFGDKFFLRFERKDQILETTGINEKMNELGLRYKFIF